MTIEFTTDSGAIGYAIDYGTYIDIYVTDNANITISNGEVSLVALGSYTGLTFNKTSDLAVSNSISLEADTLYRIEYSSNGKITSTTWDNIGG